MKKLVAESGASVYSRPAEARAVASEMQTKLYVGLYLGHHARTSSMFSMTIDGVVISCRVSKDECWKPVECRQLKRSSWSSLGCHRKRCRRCRGHVLKLPIFFGRHVGAVSRGQSGETIGCSACSDIAVDGLTAKPHTEECRTTIGEQNEHDPEGHERLQVHRRGGVAEPEVEGDCVPV